jgi:hypothetical protein
MNFTSISPDFIAENISTESAAGLAALLDVLPVDVLSAVAFDAPRAVNNLAGCMARSPADPTASSVARQHPMANNPTANRRACRVPKPNRQASIGRRFVPLQESAT